MSQFKLRISILVIIFSLSTYMKAEDKGIPVPDNVGKHLFELFQNRVNITSSPFYQSTTDNEGWASLLREADKLGLSSDNMSYDRTFFKQVRDYLKDTAEDEVEMHILLKASDKQYAFSVEVVWNNGWKVQRIDSKLYECKLETISGSPQFDEAYEWVEDTNTQLGYAYNTSYQPSKIEKDVYITDITDFGKDILKALINSSAFGTENIFMTEKDFTKIVAKELKQYAQLVLVSDDVPSGLREEMEKIVKDPLRVYKEHQVTTWERLVGDTKNEFGAGMSKFKIVGIEQNISNYGAFPKAQIWMNGSMDIQVDEQEERTLEYQGMWNNGMWKILYVEGYLMKNSGISVMDSDTSEDVDVYELSPITIE